MGTASDQRMAVLWPRADRKCDFDNEKNDSFTSRSASVTGYLTLCGERDHHGEE